MKFLRNNHLRQAAAMVKDISPENRGESYSTELTGEEKRIIYSGDVFSCLHMRVLFDRPVDLLLCEMAHFDPADFNTLTAVNQPAVTAFSHFHPKLDVHPELLLKEIFARYPNRIIFAEDGCSFSI